jgi:GNAT superfamily N-acetyltransferase
MEIRALHEGDDRSRFQSGDPDLDRFVRLFAGQNQFKHHLGVSYVAVEDRRILGCATVAPGHVEVEGLPAAWRKKLPRYPLPVLRLARLAVDQSARGKGLGARLLRFVLRLGLRMASDYGCVGVVADANPGAIDFYARFGFLPIDVIEGGSDVRPQPTPMFLSIRAVEEASR